MGKNNPAIIVQRTGRRLVQVGFLLLFLYPLAIILYQKIYFSPAATFPSWLLWWDPALLIGRSLQLSFTSLIIGPPLVLIALTFVFGRSFCGWICPMGTILDLFRPLAFWQKRFRRKTETGNSKARYLLLAFVLGAALFSLKYIGLLDPLVIFHRSTTTLAANSLPARAAINFISLIFLAILTLELWQPRFWCRNLCPIGAILSLVSRYSILKRVVSPEVCTGCAACQRSCPMNAIRDNGKTTDRTDCTLCLECDHVCPRQGISFHMLPEPQTVRTETYGMSRRQFLTSLAAGTAGLAVQPLIELAPHHAVLRPPGAIPEEQFLRTCIACQECIRVCPTGALRPALLENGVVGLGTPILVPRQGGCALNPSCPDLCAAVCPVKAILPITQAEMKIGLARVHREVCLAWDQGARCLVCVEACLNSAAIAFNGRVTVDPNRCTGCGRCEAGCPVPGSAIRVEPLDLRQIKS